jgi:F0F1-type ATP synthase assembly protein I
MKSAKSDDSSQLRGVTGSFQKAAPYINISYVLIASIAMLGLLGWWMDKQFMTKPLFTVSGILGGLFLGLYNLFKVIKKMENANK